MTNLEKLSINFLAELKGYQFDLWDSNGRGAQVDRPADLHPSGTWIG
jgi:hypothetical protein